MKSRYLSAALILSAAMLSAQAANADDWKSQAGSDCTPGNSQATWYRSSSGLLVNDHATNSLIVHCPMVRDVEAAGNQRLEDLVVRVRDNNPGVSGSCRVYTRSNTGGATDWQSISWSGTGTRTLDFDPLSAPAWGVYNLYCILPPDGGSSSRSYIQNYRYREDG